MTDHVRASSETRSGGEKGAITGWAAGVPFTALPPVHGDPVHGDAIHGDAIHGDAVRGDAVRGDAVRGDRNGAGDGGAAPLVVTWHMMDSPRPAGQGRGSGRRRLVPLAPAAITPAHAEQGVRPAV
ncbi:hypothetical protein FAIPA1_40219 [Frankia sp. AiPs1]